MNRYEQQIEELWHNLFRMHGYVEAALNYQGGEVPQLLQRANVLLKASRARVDSVLSNTSHWRKK